MPGPHIPDTSIDDDTTNTEAQATDERMNGPSRDALIAELAGLDLAAEGLAPATGPGMRRELDEAPPAPAAAPPAAAPAPAAAGGEAPKQEDDEPEIARILRQRAEAQRAREAELATGKSAAEKLVEEARQRAEAEAERIVAAARAKADAELATLRERPLDAIKRIGWTGNRLVDEVVREGTPEWRAQKELEAANAAQAKRLEELAATVGGLTKAQEQFVEQQRAAGRARAEEIFLSHANAEKAPNLHLLHGSPEAVLALAHKTAAELGLTDVASIPKIAQYLEYEAAKKVAAIRAQGAPEGQRQVGATSTAPAGRANGSRTLSSSLASERRAEPRSLEELSPREQRKALVEEAEAAMTAASRRG